MYYPPRSKMEFGRISPDAEAGDIVLPKSPTRAPFVRADGTSSSFELRFGLPVWARDEFVGPLYPEDTKKSDYLAAYAERCSAIELNATFYSVPTLERTRGWAADTPETFRFCPKMPKGLSHGHELKKEMLNAFVGALEGFGNRLGVTFIQLPEWADTSFRRPLFDLLEALPSNMRFALELRHEHWFSEEATFTRLRAYLEKKGIGLAITDAPGRRDVVHMALTAPFTFVRFLGHDAGPEDRRRIDEWLGRFEEWKTLGLEEAYFFIHHPNEVDGVPLLEPLRDWTARVR